MMEAKFMPQNLVIKSKFSDQNLNSLLSTTLFIEVSHGIINKLFSNGFNHEKFRLYHGHTMNTVNIYLKQKIFHYFSPLMPTLGYKPTVILFKKAINTFVSLKPITNPEYFSHFLSQHSIPIKGVVSSLKQFLATESPLKVMTKCVLFHL